MFSPVTITVVSIIAWFLASKRTNELPRDLPRDTVTREHVEWAWYGLALMTAVNTAVIAVMALSADALSLFDRESWLAQWAFFCLGLVFARDGIRAAIASADVFRKAKHQGRAPTLEEGDYWPSWVIMPLFPLVLSISY